MTQNKKYVESQVAPVLLQAMGMPKTIKDRDVVRAALEDMLDKHLIKHVYDGLLTILRGPQVGAAIRAALDAEIESLIKTEIAKRQDEIEARVRDAVAARLEEQINVVARRLLEDELEKIRRRLT